MSDDQHRAILAAFGLDPDGGTLEQAQDEVARLRLLLDATAYKRGEVEGYLMAAEIGKALALRFAKALTEYGVHLSNCPYESWNEGLTDCSCGLFALIKDAEGVLASSGEAA